MIFCAQSKHLPRRGKMLHRNFYTSPAISCQRRQKTSSATCVKKIVTFYEFVLKISTDLCNENIIYWLLKRTERLFI